AVATMESITYQLCISHGVDNCDAIAVYLPQTSYLDLTEYSSLKGKNVGMKPEGDDVVEGHGEAEVGSDSDGELQERDERDESEGKDSGSDQIGQRVVTSRRSPEEEKDEAHISDTAREIRDVFGESDDEEPADYDAAQTNVEDDTNRIGVVGVNFNAQTHVKSFTGLKAATSGSCESIKASFKLSILGAAACIGKPLCISPHPHDHRIIKDVVAMQSSAPPRGLNEARPRPQRDGVCSYFKAEQSEYKDIPAHEAGAATAIINIGKTRADNFADLKINARLEEICFRTTILIEPPIYLNPDCSLLLMHRYYQGFSLAHLAGSLHQRYLLIQVPLREYCQVFLHAFVNINHGGVPFGPTQLHVLGLSEGHKP
ncbi:hypothetical protein Tco_0562675, partial [Tanacetum coccineum]